MIRRLGLTLAVAGAAALLVFPAAGRGDVRIGIDLNQATPAGVYDCGLMMSCTLRTSVPNQPHPRQASPVTGVVTSFRLQTGSVGASQVSLRVIRPVGGNMFAGIATGPPVSVPADRRGEFEVDLPIRAGDTIGLDQNGNDGVISDAALNQGFLQAWGGPGTLGPLADGQTRRPDQTGTSVVMINADVEPATKFKLGKLKRKGKKRIRVKITVPNPGRLQARGKDRGQVKAKSRDVVAGKRLLTLKLARPVLRKLAVGRTPKLKLRFHYEPDFGEQVARTLRGKIKPRP